MARPRLENPNSAALATRRHRARKKGEGIPLLKKGYPAGVRIHISNHGTLYEYQKYGCRCNECVIRYRQSLPSKHARRAKQRATDPAYNILNGLRSTLTCAMHRSNVGKSSDTMSLLGCSIGRFMEYLQAHFQPGMTWRNYGEWHIDHIKPVSKFDLSDPEQQRACFNWLNLQPLWAKDNLRKGSKYGEQ